MGLASSLFAIGVSALATSGTAVKQVNIIGLDDRVEIEKISALDPGEIEMLYSNIGQISCQFEGRGAAATAILVEGRYIVANAHAMISDGQLSSNCTFVLKRHAGLPIRIAMNAVMLGTREPQVKGNGTNDWAIAPLANPIETKQKLAFSYTAPVEGDSLVLVTAVNNAEGLDGTKLIGRSCGVRDTLPPAGKDQTAFTNDCDSVAGDSGGAYFIRKGGKLSVAGIHVMGGFRARDGMPYNGDAGKLSASGALALDGPLGAAIASLSVNPPNAMPVDGREQKAVRR
jgi:hypothetical protein